MKRKVGSTVSFTTVRFSNRLPVVDPSASEWIDSHLDLRVADDTHVDHIAEVADIGREVLPITTINTTRIGDRTPCKTFAQNMRCTGSRPINFSIGRYI
jgi:hypothetical protein